VKTTGSAGGGRKKRARGTNPSDMTAQQLLRVIDER
jgi:hypothetical protein